MRGTITVFHAVMTLALAGLLLAGWSSPCLAWGTVGHVWIVNEAVQLLPDTAAQYMKKYYRGYIYRHVMEPDLRKEQDENEGVRHFFDLDDYLHSGLRVQDWPWSRATARQRVGDNDYAYFGQGPWALAETKEQLVAALRAHDWARTRVLFADLSHYVGDLNQPLHCTENYNGQMTGNYGVHMRFEKELLQRYSKRVPHAAGTPGLIADPLLFNFRMTETANARVNAIMAADRSATWSPELYDRTYYEKFWTQVQPTMTAALHAGAVNLASYYLTIVSEAQQAGVFTALAEDTVALRDAQDSEIMYEARDADQDRGRRHAGRGRNRYDRDRREQVPDNRPPSPAEQATRRYLIAGGLLIGLGGIGAMVYAARRRKKNRAGKDDDEHKGDGSGGYDVFGD